MAPTTCVHQVTYLDAPEARAASTAAFLAASLLRGEAVVVVATPEHRERLALGLFAAGVDLGRARAEGRYDERDAAQVLAGLLGADGTVAADRFRTQVSDPLVRLGSRFGSVSVYGEMVGLLTGRGDLAAALRLEELWVALLAELPLRLLCGYPGGVLAVDDRRVVDRLHDREALAASGTAAVGLPADASAGPLARQALVRTFVGWGLLDEEWTDDAELVVSELVGNAVRHGDTGVVLQLDRVGDAVRFMVSDDSTDLPAARSGGELAEGGRGLLIVEALAEQWGVERRPGGKAVWARLRRCPGLAA